jgi:hypothetical protein
MIPSQIQRQALDTCLQIRQGPAAYNGHLVAGVVDKVRQHLARRRM